MSYFRLWKQEILLEEFSPSACDFTIFGGVVRSKLSFFNTTKFLITVEQMLQTTNLSQLPTTQATVADLRSLALALFESLNDKNIALSHQKKANK